MTPEILIQQVAVFAIPVVFAFAWHEAGHAYVANHFGDSTPRLAGRLTLNPFVHLDLVGSVLMPLVLLFTTAGLPGGPFLIGYAKPTPFRPGNLRNPRRHSILVSAAGAGSNFLQALAWTIIGLLLEAAGVEERFFWQVAHAGVTVNLVLAAFNLFPIPPLDGGRILADLLPWRVGQALSRVEPFGFFVVLGLAMTGLLNMIWMRPIVGVGQAVLDLATSPLALLIR